VTSDIWETELKLYVVIRKSIIFT